MSIFKPEYETYQDVKSTLAWWGAPVWAVFFLSVYCLVLTDAHRQAVLKIVPGLSEWVANVGVWVAAFVAGAVTSHIAVHLLEIHDHFYDRYVIRWRKRYAKQQMIPELLKPYAGRLREGCAEAAIEDPRRTLRLLFYRFASDRDTKIGQNLIVRFYERVTKYWLTQTAEIAILLLAVVAIVYGLLFYGPSSMARIAPVLSVYAVLFGVNRIFAWILRRSVWEATRNEIVAIHSSCKAEFEESLKELCKEYGFDFEKTENQA